MKEAEVLAALAAGELDAYAVLMAADPTIERRFKRIDGALVKLLSDVRDHFPDAEYYTASSGFHLLLGHSHGYPDKPQQQLVALNGKARIGDGDF